MAAEITDSELREELVAHGMDVGPITDATRSLWLKKLDKLNVEKRKKRKSLGAAFVPNGDDHALAGFSSDPDDDYGLIRPSAGGSKSRNNNNNRRQSGRQDAASRKSMEERPKAKDAGGDKVAGPIPGAANIRKRFADANGGQGDSDKEAKEKLRKYVRDLEDGEISDTDSENDRKFVNGKGQQTLPKHLLKPSLPVSSSKNKISVPDIKPILKSNNLKTTKDSKGSDDRNSNNRQPVTTKVSTGSQPKVSSSLSAAFSKPFQPQPDSTTSIPIIVKATASKPFSLISARPAISRQRSTIDPPTSTTPTLPAGVSFVPPSPSDVGSSNRGTTQPNLILHETVISDPHNSLSSQVRPRLSMGLIGPRSSTPHHGHLTHRLEPTRKTAIAVNGVNKELSNEGSRPLPQSSGIPPSLPSKFQTVDEEVLSKEFRTSSTESFMMSDSISVVIVLLAAVFFLILGFAYLNLFSTGDDLPRERLQLGDSSSQTRDITMAVLNELKRVAAKFNCKEIESSEITVEDMKAILKKNYEVQIDDKMWQEVVNLIRSSNIAEYPVNMTIKFLDNQGGITEGQFHKFLVKSEYTPLKCFILQLLWQIFLTVGALAATFTSIWLVHRIWRKRKQQREENKKKVFAMVDSILEFLSCQSQTRLQEMGEKSPVFAIAHVRDALIAPADRMNLHPTWTKACEFISENESRIREETQMIKGEEYNVWRWLASTTSPVSATKQQPEEPDAASSLAASVVTQAVPDASDEEEKPSLPSATSSSASSHWQGQAFQNIRLNAPPYSLTQCLKIRNMFDPDVEYGSAWQLRLQDAILDKCGPTAHIQHIAVAVDKVNREGCVYVKCRDADSSGVAYRALHGWWYDGKLVSVKYLPLKRYHERFPETVYTATLLQPSSFTLKSSK